MFELASKSVDGGHLLLDFSGGVFMVVFSVRFKLAISFTCFCSLSCENSKETRSFVSAGSLSSHFELCKWNPDYKLI